ncbi:LamB/YcsF family protein [Maribacter confluentis]|uniref:LamB/YcsF family protein n=1 Tax=Maribacter confluentis TaxID=1656093 RepID=A0ABT8RUE3_9FLAO|nr:LamB/YcsF family protein [Maribacter confluentis]MDO1514488.1 LamB/YcsF family protein [Maribacter confluentis]
MGKSIDINCDVGEGVGNEEKLFPLISSCNIACGGHAGSAESIAICLQLAKIHEVAIGAHPSYPDRENFGRVSMTISHTTLIRQIREQLKVFTNICNKLDMPLHHIKPHGALYNDIANNRNLALVFLNAVEPYRENTYLYVPYGSLIAELAISAHWDIKREAFADRNYHTDLSLVSRKEENALITNAKDVWEHLLLMVKENHVKTIENMNVPIHADTYCFHGDTPAASDILTYITSKLSEFNLQLKP